jgi:eukaryotic-like serine/threonine-protein kinase
MSKGGNTGPKLSGMKFLVEGIIHTDETGTVMRIGDQAAMGKPYALKVVKREGPNDDLYIELAKAHHAASQKLGHASLLKYYDFRPKKSWFKISGAELLMEFVQGKSLDQLAKLGVAHLALIFHQAAAALNHLHRREMRHGDLRPDHILLTKNGEVKIIGYGLNLLTPAFLEKFTFAKAYQAPEQHKSKIVSDKADIYSLGAVMYKCVTGHSANSGGRGKGELEQKLPEPSRVNPAVTAMFSEIILACLNTHAPKRPDSMYDLQLKLEAVVKDMGAESFSLKGLASDKAEDE